jgi:Ran GTPase-activating protein (RanGAP) involved in mRNA processing and transport
MGVIHLSNGLCNSNHIVSMDLSMNKITSRGAEYLAKALQYNQSLIELNLSSGNEAGNNRNRISEKGAEFIAAALVHN